MSHTQRRVAVIGAGLIGGSIAKALRGRPDLEVVIHDADARVRFLAAADGFAAFPSDAVTVAQADIVILAMPTAQLSQTIMNIAGHLRPGTVVFETGMVKSGPYRAASELAALRPDVTFGCLTPMAGSEQPGYAHADANLFAGAPFFVGNPRDAITVIDTAIDLVERLGGGAIQSIDDPAEHDMFVALVSQAPQLLVAATTAHLAEGSVRSSAAGRVSTLTPALFERALRLAGSPRGPAAEAFADNRGPLGDVLRRTRTALEDLLFDLSSPDAVDMHRRAVFSTRRALETRFPSDDRRAADGDAGHAQRVVEMMGFALVRAAGNPSIVPAGLPDPLAFAGPALGDSTALAVVGIESLYQRVRDRGVSGADEYERAIRDAEQALEYAQRVLLEFRNTHTRTLPVIMPGSPLVQQQPTGGERFARCFDLAAAAYAHAQPSHNLAR